jgi:predicted ATPase
MGYIAVQSKSRASLTLPAAEYTMQITMSPQRQKQKTQEALVSWLLADAAQQPVLAVWEDLHWADPSTLELLGLLLDQVPTTRLLLVLTCRPEFQPPWALRSYMASLTLTRLMRLQVEEMVLQVTGGKSLPAEVMQQIVAKTDGIPLVVEELVKTRLESGLVLEETDHYVLTGPLPPLAIPATLQDALMARLDRLAAVKEVAQLGAVLGREFSYELLRAVAPLHEPTLQHGLAQLVKAELLYQWGLPPLAQYVFKHALIRDAACQSLLRSTRQQYHQRIAQVLAEQFSETTETQPELLAYHYTEAGLYNQALDYWQRAGQRAMSRSAYMEAVAHLTKGLEVLNTLPDTSMRAQCELNLRLALGRGLIITKGYAAPEVEHVYTRAYTLCQQIEDVPQLFNALRGLWNFYIARAQLQTAQELGMQLLDLARRQQAPALLLAAHLALGQTAVHLGVMAQAHTHFGHVVDLYNPQESRRYAVQDPLVTCHSYAAHALWHLGYPDQARKRINEARTLAQELSSP